MLAKVETPESTSHLLLCGHMLIPILLLLLLLLSSCTGGSGIQLELRIQLQMLASRQIGYQYVILPADAHIVLTSEQHLTRGLHRLPGEQLDQCALPGTIASQQAADLVACKVQTQIRYGKLAAIHLGHTAQRGTQLGVQMGACNTHKFVVI